MFGWGPRFNKEKISGKIPEDTEHNNEKHSTEMEKTENKVSTNEILKNPLFKNKILKNENSQFHPETEKNAIEKSHFTKLYEPFIHIENDYDPIYDDISVVLKNMDTFDYYNDFNNSPTIESIINTIKNKRVETMGSETTIEKNSSNQYKILYSGFAGKFYSRRMSKTKLMLCIPAKIFDIIGSGDFFKINYKSCNECEFIYKTPRDTGRIHETNSAKNQGNFIELGPRCVFSLCDFSTNQDLPAELAEKYVCYEFICGDFCGESESSTTEVFKCLNSLYEHCKNSYYNQCSKYTKNTYKSVVSGKYIDYHELLWNEPICRVVDIWHDVSYVLVINRDVFNTVYVTPEHKLTSATLGTFKCNPALATSSVSGNGFEINAQDYLVKFSSKDNNFNETSESRVVYLLAWVSDVIKHRAHEHEKKYSKWMRIDELQ